MSIIWRDNAAGVELDIAGKMPRVEYLKVHLLYHPSAPGCGLEVA
jgi:hypothetical protein